MVLRVVAGKRLGRSAYHLGDNVGRGSAYFRNYLDRIYRALEEMDRVNVTVRFVATGYEDDEDEEAG